MLIDLLILVLLGVVAYWIITKFFPAPFTTVALAVVGVILLFALLQIFGVLDTGVGSRLLK